MSHADARVLNNLFWLVIVICCWAVLNSKHPLLRWVIIAFDGHISTMILARWSVTLHNYNPLISLTIPICSWKAIMVNWIIQVHYSRQIITISTQLIKINCSTCQNQHGPSDQYWKPIEERIINLMCFHEWMPLSSYEWLSIGNKVRKKPFSFGLILYWIEILSSTILTDLKWLWKMKMLEVARSNMLEIQLKKKLRPLVKRLLLYNNLFWNLLLGYLLNSDN